MIYKLLQPPTELTLMLPFSQIPLLPSDWPYFQLKVILQNYVENVKHISNLEFSGNVKYFH